MTRTAHTRPIITDSKGQRHTSANSRARVEWAKEEAETVRHISTIPQARLLDIKPQPPRRNLRDTIGHIIIGAGALLAIWHFINGGF